MENKGHKTAEDHSKLLPGSLRPFWGPAWRFFSTSDLIWPDQIRSDWPVPMNTLSRQSTKYHRWMIDIFLIKWNNNNLRHRQDRTGQDGVEPGWVDPIALFPPSTYSSSPGDIEDLLVLGGYGFLLVYFVISLVQPAPYGRYAEKAPKALTC